MSGQPPTLVRDIMITDVATISPLASLREALDRMRQYKVKSLPVEPKDAYDAWGIITYRNLLSTILSEDGDIDLINVYDVYSKPAISVSENLALQPVASMMIKHGFRRLLVLENNQLKGIVSMSDIVDSVVKKID